MPRPLDADQVRDRVDVRPVDLAMAVLVALFMTFSALDQPGGRTIDTVGIALLALGGLVLVAHRVWPVPVLVTALTIQLLHYARGYPEGAEWLATTVALGSLTWSRGWRISAPFAAILVLLSNTDVVRSGAPVVDAEHALVVVGVVCAVSIGEWLRTREAYLVVLAEQARAQARHRADETRLIVGEERLRIAREVHDIVGHAIAAINVQAGVGAHVGAREPARAREALVVIKQASGEALGDLRAVLGMLQPADGTDAAAPGHAGPRLVELDALVDRVRATGLEVACERRGRPHALPVPVDQAAYRIVQEALTNAVKHAPGAQVRIVVEYGPDVLVVAVTSAGTGSCVDSVTAGRPALAAEEGHGIRGMRERAAALGGRLEARPLPGGGFLVTSELPARVPAA